MRISDPYDKEQKTLLDDISRKASLGKLRNWNVLLIILSIIGVFGIFILQRFDNIPLNIVMPLYSILVPSIIPSLYPSKVLISDQISKRALLHLRLNPIGAAFLTLAMNLFYISVKGWNESIIVVIVVSHIIAFVIALREIFSDELTSLSRWTASEFASKSILITILCMINGHTWSALKGISGGAFALSNQITSIAPLFGLTILIPFLAGLLVSNQIHVKPLKTYSLDNEELLRRFER